MAGDKREAPWKETPVLPREPPRITSNRGLSRLSVASESSHDITMVKSVSKGRVVLKDIYILFSFEPDITLRGAQRC
jgi:hypothetical protein